MKAIFINGSPRKKWNTHEVLLSAMKGAEAAGAETELYHLYDLQFKGCMSCFACKLKNSRTEGVCAIRDELRPILEKCKEADIIVLGSPIYYSSVTGVMRAFMERLMFPAGSYELDENCVPNYYFKEGKRTALIYTMNITEEALKDWQYREILSPNSSCMKQIFGYCEELYVCNTYQFSDYSKYAFNLFKEEDKARYHKEHFPIDLQKAFELGKRLVEGK